MMNQAQRRARTRDKLIRAAIEVVARHGFHGATVDVIARRAGYSTGALYAHFAGKDALFLAVFDEHVRWFEQRVREAFEAPDVTEAAARWLRLVSGRPQQFLVFVEFWAYAVRRPKVRTAFARRMAAMRDSVADAVRSRAEAGGRQPVVDPELAALMLLAGGRGLALETLVDADAFDERPLLELLGALAG